MGIGGGWHASLFLAAAPLRGWVRRGAWHASLFLAAAPLRGWVRRGACLGSEDTSLLYVPNCFHQELAGKIANGLENMMKDEEKLSWRYNTCTFVRRPCSCKYKYPGFDEERHKTVYFDDACDAATATVVEISNGQGLSAQMHRRVRKGEVRVREGRERYKSSRGGVK